jgi:hypothetical protein
MVVVAGRVAGACYYTKPGARPPMSVTSIILPSPTRSQAAARPALVTWEGRRGERPPPLDADDDLTH